MRRTSHFSSIPKNLTSVFMAMLLAGESTHYNPEHHNPHGNRRERIEEMRQRMAEAQQQLAGARTMASGGSNPPPSTALHVTTAGRRRMFGIDGQP